MRLAMLDTAPQGLICATLQMVDIDNHRCVRVSDVSARALVESSAFYFLQWIVLWNSSKLIQAMIRAPPTTFDSVLQRDVERRAIHAGLSARNYFHVLLCGAGVSLYSNVILSDAKNF